MTLDIAQSTPTAAAMARWVERAWDLGPVVGGEFLRRSFNQVYRIDFASGQRAVARLSSERPRGPANTAFEAALHQHLAAQGCPVVRCLPARGGAHAVDVPLPEGPRPLMLFDYVEGDFTGEAPEDIAAFARGLAALHAAGASYAGPPSRYALELPDLLDRPLQDLLRAPTMLPELRPGFEAAAERLRARLSALEPLTRVMGHGDAHGENNFMRTNAQGEPEAVFFDFDEAGPGCLAYELAIYPWSMFPRMPDTAPSERVLARWRSFIDAYRAVRPLSAADQAAIAPFMAVRQFWLLGEYAGRVPVWGSQAMPTMYLRKQLGLLAQWEALELPF
ncbi:phosphotransferase [Ottowia sp. GY511]|nr:phosphotransferase [Ottowia sp. GY511]